MSAGEFTAPSAHDIRNLVKGTVASLTGRQRGPDRKVRKHSYDIADPRAQVWDRIADGTRRGGGRWRAALLETAEQFDVVHKQPGKMGPLQASGIRVLRVILWKALDFKTGRSEPAILTLMKWTGYAKRTVVSALARLKAHGFLNWVRRSRSTGNHGEFGPQRAQTSNAYFFDLKAMLPAVRQRFRDLVERCRRATMTEADTPPDRPAGPSGAPQKLDPDLLAVLDRLAQGIAAKTGNASS